MNTVEGRCKHGTPIALVCSRCSAEYLAETNALAPRAARLDQQQVGGDHYKRHSMTPWEIIDEYKLDFYAGNALKYLLRAKEKGGVEDLKKARHYLDKLIELNSKEGP